MPASGSAKPIFANARTPSGLVGILIAGQAGSILVVVCTSNDPIPVVVAITEYYAIAGKIPWDCRKIDASLK